jgi:RNA polymerase-associated protein LEO1
LSIYAITNNSVLYEQMKQSNARVIRWSDGTLSLRLGKELFDINQSIDTSAATPRQTIGAAASSQSQSQGPSQSQLQAPAPADGKGQGLTYLVAQHKRSQVLQSEALVTGYMSLRPTGMTSETHRMLVRSVEQKHKQTARLRIAPEPTVDPEREKMELMKQSARSKPKRRNADLGDGFEGTRKRKAYRRQQDRDVYWSDDDEPEGMYGGGAGSDEELDFSATRGSPRKGGKRKSEAEKDEEDYQADDFVVPDDDEEEGGGGRKQGRDQSEAEDDLERLEANIEKQAAAERKGRGSDVKKPKRVADSDEDADGMDVESEEDADDHKVRRVTSKRAIAFDEDEEDDE